MTDGQRSDLIATMVSAMPSLSFDQAQGIIGNKGPFVADIRKVFERYTKHVPDVQSTAEFTICNRTYELVPFLEEGESYVSGDTMVERAKELNANLGEEDGEFILERQAEIPKEFRGKFYMVFTAWRPPSRPRGVAYLGWDGRWYQRWGWLGGDWGRRDRLVRRRT
jgi:hypothetical protein